MGIFDAMGSAAGGMMGGGARGAIGGGNGGSFAQKQMMRNNPAMQPQGGMGAKFAMARQQAPPSTYGTQGPNKMRPTAGMPFGNQMKQGMTPGIGPRFQGQMGGIAQGMGQSIAPWMQQRNQGMDQQKMLADYQQQGQAAGNDMSWMQQPGAVQMGPQQDQQQQQRMKLSEMFRQMQGQGQGRGGMMRPQVMPGRGIAPQMSMMPQFAQQPRQPNPWGAEYDMQPQEAMY